VLQPADPDKFVLVVDDDDDIRDCLVGYLEDEGFRSLGAANGKRALEILKRSGPRPSVIVLDLMMPVMDGRGFREEQLRVADLADIPVILISAYADLTETARELKVAECLSKPIDPMGLLAVVRQYL
jgi:two-component system, chemotaxis family, chemotaxis protein CheY